MLCIICGGLVAIGKETVGAAFFKRRKRVERKDYERI
jgi:hypothetical protein